MNRFSAREFALLCLPVAAIAGAGLWVSTRPAPVPLHLDFRVEKPTTLEAFEGANAALNTTIRGDGAAEVRMDIAKTQSFLEVRTAQGTQNASSQSWPTPSVWDKVWTSQNHTQDGLRVPFYALALPDGEAFYVLKTQAKVENRAPGAPAATPTPLAGRWKIDRAQFAPFDFKKMPRTSQVRVRAVKIISARPGWIEGETSFDLSGVGMNARTPVDVDLSGTVAFKNMKYGIGYETNAIVDAKNSLRRVMKWTLHGPTPTPPQTFGDLHGRISADERWPLAFQVEPIDISKVKAGQKLKWKQWPVAIPKL